MGIHVKIDYSIMGVNYRRTGSVEVLSHNAIHSPSQQVLTHSLFYKICKYKGGGELISRIRLISMSSFQDQGRAWGQV